LNKGNVIKAQYRTGVVGYTCNSHQEQQQKTEQKAEQIVEQNMDFTACAPLQCQYSKPPGLLTLDDTEGAIL
jgi:hypothetical protein